MADATETQPPTMKPTEPDAVRAARVARRGAIAAAIIAAMAAVLTGFLLNRTKTAAESAPRYQTFSQTLITDDFQGTGDVVVKHAEGTTVVAVPGLPPGSRITAAWMVPMRYIGNIPYFSTLDAEPAGDRSVKIMHQRTDAPDGKRVAARLEVKIVVEWYEH